MAKKSEKFDKSGKETVSIPSINAKGKDGITTSYSIKEIENGFLVTRSTSNNAKGEYSYESRDYFVQTNPIAKESDNMYEIIEAALKNSQEEGIV